MLTFYKCNSGFSGMPAVDSRSFSCHYHDRESHAIHCSTYNFPLVRREVYFFQCVQIPLDELAVRVVVKKDCLNPESFLKVHWIRLLSSNDSYVNSIFKPCERKLQVRFDVRGTDSLLNYGIFIYLIRSKL